MLIYCTYVTFYSGNKLPPFYIGSSSVSKVNSGYHGSVKSRKWKIIYETELKNNPHLFHTEIIETFVDRKDALEQELMLQIANDVVRSKMFFNESLAQPNGFFGTSESAFKGKTHSKESNKKNALAHLGKPSTTKGIPRTEESKRKMSIGRTKAQLGKSFSLVCCIYCHKVGGLNGMSRYHFDNCKSKPQLE